MRERLLARIGVVCREKPYAVLGLAAVLAIGSAALLPWLEISSSRFELIAAGEGFVEADGARTDLVAAIRGDDAATTRAASDALAARFDAELPQTQAVLARIDPSFWQGREIYFLSPLELEAVASSPRRARDLAAFVEAAHRELGGASEDEQLEDLENSDVPSPGTPVDPETGIRLLVALLENAERWQRDATVDELELGRRSAEAPPIDGEGYFVSNDGRTRFVFVTPDEATDRYEYVAPMVRQARAIAREVAETHGVTIELTGYPALAVDEVDAIRGGSLVTGVVSGVLVMALFALGFRSVGGVLVAGAPLGVGMLWAFGMMVLVVGDVNLLTQAAAPVFAGLGIDFAVHLLAAYDAERRRGATHDGSIDQAMRGAGKAVLTGGLTTAGAFLSLTITDHEAFVELGLVAGLGLLLVLAAVLWLVPALLTVGVRRDWPVLMVGTRHAPLPRTGERLAGLVTRRPWLVVSLTATATVALALGIPRIHFDPDVESLLPQDAESVRAAARMGEDGRFSNEVLVSHVSDLHALHGHATSLASLPSVGRVESAASFLPARPEEVERVLARVPPTDSTTASSPRPLPARLRDLSEAATATASDLARVGSTSLASRLTALAEAARELEAGFNHERQEAFDRALRSRLDHVWLGLDRARAGDLDPVALTDLPAPIRRRLVDDEGGYRVYIHPAHDVFAEGELTRFLSDVRSVDPDVSGSPVDFADFLESMQQSLSLAAVLAALIVTALLGADLRDVRDVLLALAPVTLGVTWLFGIMGWLGIHANMANLAALPLVLGIGVDDGVHLIHRHRVDRDVARSLRSVLRALVMTTVTTIAAFGALGLAAHRGMQSFALVMVIGSAGCLAGTTLALPGLIRLVRGQPSSKR